MSSYGFIKELIEKEHTPTPAYIFDLDNMKEYRTNDGCSSDI